MRSSREEGRLGHIAAPLSVSYLCFQSVPCGTSLAPTSLLPELVCHHAEVTVSFPRAAIMRGTQRRQPQPSGGRGGWLTNAPRTEVPDWLLETSRCPTTRSLIAPLRKRRRLSGATFGQRPHVERAAPEEKWHRESEGSDPCDA